MDERSKDDAVGTTAIPGLARTPHRMPPGHPAPVRVLLRGLELIHVLNRYGPMTTAALSQKLRLARTTVNRCLATLEGMDLVHRDEVRRFSLSLSAKTLSHGFDAVAERLEPIRRVLRETGPKVQWPITLFRFHFPDMMVEDSTDRSSGFAIEYFERGARLPVLTTASGGVFLAYSDTRVRDAILEYVWPRRSEETQALWADLTALEADLAATRERGYGKAVRPLRLTEQGSIAIPVIVDEQPVAALAVRFALSAVSFDEARRRLLPALQEIVQRAA